MQAENITDEQLLFLVGKTDADLFRAGRDIKQRMFEVPRKLMETFGYKGGYVMAGVGKPAILERIEASFRSIYRQQDLAMGGHIGVFMYRDIFARVSIPLVFGQMGINPFKFVDLTEVQLRIINSEPEEQEIFLDQFSDLADIQYGVDELNGPFAKNELTNRFIGFARLHLHAASAIVTGGYDYRGAVQSGLLAIELALKAAISSGGMDENQIREKYSHNLLAIVGDIETQWPIFDVARVRAVIKRLPPYVRNRYSPDQPDRRLVGHTVMGAQYIVAEVVRRMSDRDFRQALKPQHSRRYPAL